MMEKCVSILTAFGAKCTEPRLSGSNYCKGHQRIVDKMGIREFEMSGLKNVHFIKESQLKDDYGEKLTGKMSETQRKKIETEYQNALHELKDEHTTQQYLLWMSWDFREDTKGKK